MECNDLLDTTSKAVWNGYDIFGTCYEGSFKKHFLARKAGIYYMISCMPDTEENRNELGIMLKIMGISYKSTFTDEELNCQYLIKLVDYFIIK